MADYSSYPLWWSGERVGNIRPEDLLLNPELIRRLNEWAYRYDKTLNEDYPPESGFPTDQDEIEFEREGIRLWIELRESLSSDYDVLYYSYYLGVLLNNPDEVLKLGAKHLL